MSTYSVFFFSDLSRTGRIGGWQKRVKLVGFQDNLVVLLSLRRSERGLLIAVCWVEMTRSLVAGHVATNGDTARKNACATSAGQRSKLVVFVAGSGWAVLLACFICEGPPRLPCITSTAAPNGSAQGGC